MGLGKSALVRYRLLDEAITSKAHPYPTLGDLLDKVNEHLATLGEEKTVAKRTIQQDLYDMRFSDELGYYAPLEYSNRHRGYYYDEADYSISKLPLKGEERAVLEFTANLLARYQNMPMFSSFKQITQKIFDALNIHSAIENDQDFVHAIQFDQTPVLKGGNWLAIITESIRHYRKMSIRYQRFNATEPQSRVVHPYILKEYRNRWYLICISEQSGEPRTYALDRIVDATMLEENFAPSESMDRRKYFEHSFGIYNLKDKEPETVTLSFYPSQAGYFKTQPIHASQKILVDNEEEFRVELITYVSEDFIMFLMSYLPRVKVIGPKSLEDEILGRIAEYQRG